jgi:ribulose-5-phosphate 4-epimerase/fuculose-1-phosphate aldolase
MEGPRTRGDLCLAVGGLFRDEVENRDAGRVVEVADIMTDRVVVPVVPNSQDMEHLSAEILARLDPAVPGVIVAEHGLYAWGSSLEDAVHRTESMDWLFDYALGLDALASRLSVT